MVIKFSDKMNLLTGSEIRELLKLTEKPDIISFAGGLPAPELFPIEELKRIAVCVMEESGKQALQYSTTEGFLPLRKHIAERMLAKNKIKTDPSHILMTSGSQMGLDFSARVFLNKDDIVLLESPSYLGAINAFKASEAKFIEVPTDKEGMIISELEKNLGKEERVKMIYVIPDFQNPSGRTWSLERRQKFMEIVNKYEIPVIEDNPYGELRFEKEILPALKALDTKGLVVYLGTFSKVLVPGYRLGWVCASAEKLEKYNFIEQASSLQASTISQMEVSKYMDLYNLDDHIAKIKEVYRKRRDIMLKTMDEEFPEGVEYTRPEGGLFTWVILPEYINARNMALECIEKKVAYVPGGSFFPNGGHENTFRMNYSCMPEEKIIEGIQRIAEVIKKNMK
ncbi:aminotransferase-like domain-containing protein [Aminipila sp.]|uniref:aminotransferase-like domain-containing protein n=1 Tax=Aminipila sp. TaxID=2060095 RepID=UPI00289D11B0|nr:PLP-dependent aminotransferase family protein [Aminipila sp.]